MVDGGANSAVCLFCVVILWSCVIRVRVVIMTAYIKRQSILSVTYSS
jgi:hypothetical protein